jgi:hypothetical protein
MQMKKSLIYVGTIVVVLGLVAGSGFAANGKGTKTQDRKQTKICICPISVDVKPMDGVCDLCGGCIPLRDGTKSSDRDQIRKQDGPCLMASADLTVTATEMMAGKGQGKGAGKGKGACKRDGSCAMQPNS